MYTTLMRGRTIEDCMLQLDLFLEYFFRLIHEHHSAPVHSRLHGDAEIVNQMMFTKGLNLKKVLEGVGYRSEISGMEMNVVIDPTIVASLVRNIYETVCMFHLVYINTMSNDEKNILYNLWAIAGLKYRQRFESSITTSENQQKLEEEERQIQWFITEIEANPLFLSLDERNQKVIREKIKEKDYKISFDGGRVRSLSWQEISAIMTNNHPFFENIYTYFSLYAHPSNVSVFQFADMFKKNDEAFIRKTILNIRYCFILFSIFIADYIKLFPEVKEIYERQGIESQIMLNAHNKLIRGDSHSINEAWKALE